MRHVQHGESFAGRARKALRESQDLIRQSNALRERATALQLEFRALRDSAQIARLPSDSAMFIDGVLSSMEQALLRSEDWLTLAADGSGLGLWYWDELSETLYWDQKTRDMFGAPANGKVTLQTFIDALHADDRDRVIRHWRDCFENRRPYLIDLRAVRPDGEVRWIHGRGQAYYHHTGKPLRMVGVVFDVTQRRAAEQERIELSGRLISAQEDERRRLARELHDDFSQRLALFASELDLLSGMIKGSSPEADRRMRALRKLAHETAMDLHSLSHRLHSSKLEILGLAANVKSHCKEFAQQHAIQIDAVCDEIPDAINPETKLCIFRVLQEALRNVTKHSKASTVEVRLKRDSEAISLTLSDNGRGFDLAENNASNGIGILSMRERARILGGTLEVHSVPTKGTKIVM